MEEVNIIVGDDGVVECSSITGFFGQDHLHNVGMMPQMDVMAPAHRPLHGQVAHEEDVTTSTTTADHSMSSQMEKEVEDDSYEESFHERCIICGIVINKMKGGWVNIQEETTSTSEKQLVDMIHSVIAESPDVRYRFMTHTMCRRCYNLLDRADEIQVKMKVMQEELTSIKTDMRQTFKLTSTSNKDIVKVVKEIDKLSRESEVFDKVVVDSENSSVIPTEYIKLRFSCPSCDKSFKRKKCLVNHFENCHEDVTSVVCQICGCEDIDGIVSYVNHLTECYSKSQHEDILSKDFNDKLVVLKNKNKVRLFPCKICSDVFVTQFNLQEHTFFVHQQSEENDAKPQHISYILRNLHLYCTSELMGTYSCPLCDKILKSDNSMRIHIEIEHRCNLGDSLGLSIQPTTKAKYTFRCPHCDKYFANGATIKLHLLRMHAHITNFDCPSCSNSFMTKYEFECHVSIHHPTVARVLRDNGIIKNFKNKLECPQRKIHFGNKLTLNHYDAVLHNGGDNCGSNIAGNDPDQNLNDSFSPTKDEGDYKQSTSRSTSREVLPIPSTSKVKKLTKLQSESESKSIMYKSETMEVVKPGTIPKLKIYRINKQE